MSEGKESEMDGSNILKYFNTEIVQCKVKQKQT